jgi:hypothetical protein
MNNNRFAGIPRFHFSWRPSQSGKSRRGIVAAAAKARVVVSVLAVAVLVFMSHSAAAQVLYGSVVGTVTDPSNAAVAGAKVDATEVHKGITQETTTDSTGLYRFSELLPGLWKITVSAPGFNAAETDNISLDPNTEVREDEKLSLVKAVATVTVTTAPPELQTDRADVHMDLSTAELQELPEVGTEGKNFQDLLRIIPGANIPLESNSAAGNPSRGMTTNVNGQSTQGNDTRIDGILDAYPWLPNNVAYVPPEDSIDTVNIATNSFDAEQGMVNGAEVNVETKSGTNKFHGDAHEFHTDDRLKALSYFNPPPSVFKRPLLVFNQLGGALGGPIKKDKLFFFGDYEGTRQSLAPAGGNPQTVPFGNLLYSNAKSAGCFDFSQFQNATYGLVDSAGKPVGIYDPTTGNLNGSGRAALTCANGDAGIPLSRVDPASLTLASLLPPPAPNLASDDVNNYLDSSVGFFHRDNYDAKINYVASQNSTLWGRFSFSNGDIFDPPSLGKAEGNATNGGQLGNAATHIYVVGIGGTHTFTPNLLVDGVIGFTRQHLTAQAPDIAADGQYGLDTLKIPGTNNSVDPSDQRYWGIPAFQFNTWTNFGNPNTGNPFVFRDNQYIEAENLTWVHGNHQVRVGSEWDHTQMNHFQPQGGTFQTARGTFGFNGSGFSTEQVTCPSSTAVTGCAAADAPVDFQWNSYADFLLGLPWQDGKAVQDSDPIALRWSEWSIYARDQWQVTPKLSLNYGVRWEFYPMAYSDHGKGARVLDPLTMQVLIGGYGSVPENDGVQTGHGEFLPRVGIDYRLTDKTVVRAGFGISSDSNDWRYLRNDYPADTISTFNGQTPGGAAANGSPFSAASSLTGLNATGGYSGLNTGILLIATPSLSSGSIPFPGNGSVSTSTVGTYPNFRRGYIYSYNLTVEQQFAGFVADLGYVGDNEIRPIINLNINPGVVLGGGAAGQLLNQKFSETFGSTSSGINSLVPLGNSYYSSMQAKLTRRMGQSSQVGVLYTWSKAEDIEDNEELSSPLWNDPAIFSRNKALSGFDHKYNFETYWLYDLPFGKGERWATNGIASKLAGGWTLSGVLSRLGGAPFTVTDNNDNGALNTPFNQQTPDLIAPVKLYKGRPDQTPANCTPGTASCSYFSVSSFAAVPAASEPAFGDVGRNTIRGPGYFDMDANLFRNFKIREFLTFQFEADAFSLTNTPHFGNPSSDIGSGTRGIVTSEVNGGTNSSLGGSEGERLWYFGGKFIF